MSKGKYRRKQASKNTNNASRNEAGLLPANDAAYDASVSIQTPEVRTEDTFQNFMTKTGAGTQGLLEATRYPMERKSQNYNLMNSLYRSNWVVGNIVSTIPQDVTKKWFNVETSERDQADIDKFMRACTATQLRQKIVSGMTWGNLYGGAAGIILIKGDKDLSEPLIVENVMPDSFAGLYIVDRWSGIYPSLELINDITDPNFGLPEYYEVRNERGVAEYRVHHSRVVRFIGIELPYYEQITELYWGKSVIESIYEEIVKKDNVSYNIASLVFKANLDVIQMENIDQLFALGGDQQQKRFWNLMQAQSVIQSNFGTRIINSSDKFAQYQYAFTGLKDIYEIMLLDVSGAARIPATKLFGRSPQGLNATGESDLINYYDYLEEVRESKFRPVIDKLLPIIAMSVWGEIPGDLESSFDAFRSPTEKEKAEIAYRKVGSLMDVYNGDGIPSDILLKELKHLEGVTGMFGSIDDELIEANQGRYKSDISAMHDPLAGLSLMDDFDDDPEPVVEALVEEE